MHVFNIPYKIKIKITIKINMHVFYKYQDRHQAECTLVTWKGNSTAKSVTHNGGIEMQCSVLGIILKLMLNRPIVWQKHGAQQCKRTQ